MSDGSASERTDLATGRPNGPLLFLLVVVGLLGISVACQSTVSPTPMRLPPYLRLRPCSGTAWVQPVGSLDWTALDGELVVEKDTYLRADPNAPAELCLADGSRVTVAPGVQVLLENPRVFPRLRVILQREGRVTLAAEIASLELVAPECSAVLASLPARLSLERTGGTTHLRVEEGAAYCTTESGTLTVGACWELSISQGQPPLLSEYCPLPAPAPTPTVIVRSVTPISTPPYPATLTLPPTMTASPTIPPVSPRTPVPPQTPPPATSTATHVPPTDTPVPPPPPPSPRPTDTPVPPPTEPPPPPPTDTPVPPPPPTEPPPPTKPP